MGGTELFHTVSLLNSASPDTDLSCHVNTAHTHLYTCEGTVCDLLCTCEYKTLIYNSGATGTSVRKKLNPTQAGHGLDLFKLNFANHSSPIYKLVIF